MTKKEIEKIVMDLKAEYREKSARFRAGDWTVSESELELLSKRIANWEAMLN